MTIKEFFTNNKDYKPYVAIRDYLSGDFLFEGWAISIPNEIGDKTIYRWHCMECINGVVAKYEIYVRE